MVHKLPLALSVRVQFRRGVCKLFPPEKGNHCYRLVISPTATFAHALTVLQDGLHRVQRSGLELKGIEARGKAVPSNAVLGWTLMNAEIFRVGLIQDAEPGCNVM